MTAMSALLPTSLRHTLPASITAASSSSSSRSISVLPQQQQQQRHSTTTSQHNELELTLALLKPSLCAYQPDVSAILRELKGSGLQLVRSRRLFWKAEDAHRFYAEHRGRFYYDRLVVGMTSGPAMALALAGPDAIRRWRTMLGATKAYRAKWEDPSCLRARYGLGDTRNGFHGSDSPESAQRELAQIFEGWDTRWWIDREMGRIAPSETKPLPP